MKVYKDSKIYIQCTALLATGGPELMHQFASYLISRGVETYMIYTDVPPDNVIINAALRHYHIPYTHEIDNDEKNILIVSEIGTDMLYTVGDLKLRKVIWWLSVDNFYKKLSTTYKNLATHTLSKRFTRCYSFEDDMEVEHWAQSEYAKSFLMYNGVAERKIKMVSDYLNLIFLDDLIARNHISELSNNKEDIVLFNPKKGIEFTEKLIAFAPDIKWVPIINMSRMEVLNYLITAKVYIDFGNHPGKDRIPREAAVSGCVVITGRRGAAGNDIDVPIDSNYKFDDTDDNISLIIDKIRYVLQNYNSCAKDFNCYIESIFREPVKFRQEVDDALDLSDLVYHPTICILDTANDSVLKLAAFLSGTGKYKAEYVVNDALNGQCLKFLNGELCFINAGYARQLYLEGRINKFVCTQAIRDAQEYYMSLIGNIGIDDADWEIIKIN